MKEAHFFLYLFIFIGCAVETQPEKKEPQAPAWTMSVLLREFSGHGWFCKHYENFPDPYLGDGGGWEKDYRCEFQGAGSVQYRVSIDEKGRSAYWKSGRGFNFAGALDSIGLQKCSISSGQMHGMKRPPSAEEMKRFKIEWLEQLANLAKAAGCGPEVP